MLRTDLKQRFELTYKFLLQEETNISDLGELKTHFCNALNKASVEQNVKITLAYLVLLARYPLEEEIQDITCTIKTINIEDLINQIMRGEEFEKILANKSEYYLKLADSRDVYVDVTHTLEYQNNTGIQRVVRCLCASFKNNNNNFKLFKINDAGRPINLPEEEIEYFFSWNSRIVNGESRNNTSNLSLFKQKIIRLLKNIFIDIESEWAEVKSVRMKLQRALKKLISKQKTKLSHIYEIPLFINKHQQILIPELVCEPSRIKFYKGISILDLGTNLNMIVYDLISIYYPNFFLESLVSRFVNYLTLLPYIQKVSCISKHVQEELIHFSRPLSKKPMIEYHLLGYERQNNLSCDNTISNDTIPKILCVSTIEPRKNQLNILRAAQFLWEEGFIFELQFVGAIGWKNKIFMKELESAEKEHKVKYYKHVSDELLNQLYREASFTIFVSHVEGFGLPILEPLNHGKPCITSNNSSMIEIAEKTGGCLIVNPTSILEISVAMKELLFDKEKYTRLREEAQNLKWHSWDDYAKSIYNFITNSI